MAYQKVTVANHLKLMEALRDFLLYNEDLVAAGQQWDAVPIDGLLSAPYTPGPLTGPTQESDIWLLHNTGLSGDKHIYVLMYLSVDVAQERYTIVMRGLPGFMPGQPIAEQPNRSSLVYIPCWEQPMDMWMVADAQGFRFTLKISTVAASGGVGLILPYENGLSWTLPFLIYGNIRYNTERWSTTNLNSRFIADPGYDCAYLHCFDNVWRRVTNYNSSDSASSHGPYASEVFVSPSRTYGGSSPSNGSWSSWANDVTFQGSISPALDGTYHLEPLILITGQPHFAVLGEIPGFYRVSGRGNSFENIITKDGVDYLVVQDLYRTGFSDYMAMQLQ